MTMTTMLGICLCLDFLTAREYNLNQNILCINFAFIEKYFESLFNFGCDLCEVDRFK